MDVPDISQELPFWESGIQRVAGMDEAGRGALAGPVIIGVVILPPDTALCQSLRGVRDSKQMSAIQRDHFAPLIKTTASSWAIGAASAPEIDKLGIVRAVRLAATRAMESLSIDPDILLCDFRINLPELEIPQAALVRGDQKSLSIAAASVLAKTSRDALMCALDQQYPGYRLAKHKGYGTSAHRTAIQRLGASEIHRQSFRLVR